MAVGEVAGKRTGPLGEANALQRFADTRLQRRWLRSPGRKQPTLHRQGDIVEDRQPRKDAGDLEREKTILAEQARESGKPDEIIEKMVEGRLRKYYEEVCLLEQTYVIDGETKVGKAIEAAGKEIGSPVELRGFVRFALGEGVEKKEEDFAAEVAAAAAG